MVMSMKMVVIINYDDYNTSDCCGNVGGGCNNDDDSGTNNDGGSDGDVCEIVGTVSYGNDNASDSDDGVVVAMT